MTPGRVSNPIQRTRRSSIVAGAAVFLSMAAFVVQAPDLVLAAGRGCVTPGNDGPNATLTGVVNSYYPATASAAAGPTAISVGGRVPARRAALRARGCT